ncbi:hypothetical protein [Ruminiclostridium papyrosolvens]|uniref:hypothetical protein n=1 Tax=Ruminiclostridium papyrosolvens TaxID=29362 RepID=UPI0001B2710F
MIFWFSGTGNSLYIAKSIAQQNDTKLVSITSAVNSEAEIFEYYLEDGEIIGFVFPSVMGAVYVKRCVPAKALK